MLKWESPSTIRMQCRWCINDTQLPKHEKINQDREFMALLGVVKTFVATLISSLFFLQRAPQNAKPNKTGSMWALTRKNGWTALRTQGFQQAIATWKKGTAMLAAGTHFTTWSVLSGATLPTEPAWSSQAARNRAGHQPEGKSREHGRHTDTLDQGPDGLL